ncbi:MAG: protein kinase [Vicinamibacterales bacterium]
MLPSGAEVVHEAGNTRILRVDDPVGALAYRVRTLEDERDREIFQESLAVFDGIQRAANRSEDGTAFIFRLEAVGLSSKDTREAVQVYRWVEGDTLASRLGALPPHLVIDIGLKLARALRLLHGQGILHRDIQPGNVVIDEGDYASDDLRPVLIDFGFARLIGREMRTRIAGEFAAPEVAADRPEWSRASDVYSLCATLRAVLTREAVGARELLAVLEKGLAQSPASRPAAAALGELIEELADRQKVQQQRDEAWARVRARIRSGAHLPELSATVNRHRTVLEMLEAGAYRTQEERHRVIADIVNQLAESKTRSGLARIGPAGSSPVQVLLALRVLHAHSEKLLQDGHRAALAEYRAGTPEARSGIVREALTIAARHLEVPALVPLLEPYV